MTKRSILFIGDSQCSSLNTGTVPLYETLSKALASTLKADIHITFDCQPWRRIDSCYFTEYHPYGWGYCHSALEHMNVWCARQTNAPFTDIVVMLGVNNLKKELWESGVFPSGINNVTSVHRDAFNFIQGALACNNSTTITIASSLNVRNCGGGILINTCRNDDGYYVSDYYRSDW